MTTYFPLVPSRSIAPTFTPTLDGASYNCTVIWSLFGQRYYVQCTDQTNNLIFNVALVGTQPSLVLQGLNWNVAALTVTAQTTLPHGYTIGSTVELTISGVVPNAYNGSYQAFIVDPYSFTYPLSADPGQVTSAGQTSYLISLCRGYFNSTMVFRNGQFEISP